MRPREQGDREVENDQINLDFSHLDAIYRRASDEQARLASATNPKEIALRTVWVAGIEKERVAELRFLGLEADPRLVALIDILMSDDELLTELMS